MEALELNYRTYLQGILAEKKSKNPMYSLRSFAHHIGIPVSNLSMILNGKRHLSERMVGIVSERLGLSNQQSEIFELLVKMDRMKTPTQKNRVLEKLVEVDPRFGTQRDLSVDHFRIMSEWYHFPILMLINMKSFEWTTQNVAKTLGVSSFEVEQALDRLVALDLIRYQRGERPTKTKNRILVQSIHHHEAVTRYLQTMMDRSKAAITEQPVPERFMGTETIPMSPQHFTEASQIIEECIRKLVQLSKKPADDTEVYHFGAQFFKVSKNNKIKAKNLKEKKT